MSYFISYLLSVTLTSLSYYVGSHVVKNGIALWKAFVIGTAVVTLGALTEAFGAPIWLIVLTPFPVGMLLLYVFLKKPFLKWFLTYSTILLIYTIVHIIMSYFFDFHSLIPAWKLS
ncbi:hypothetical protein H8S33_16980 [Ornithinibacillus sp. BX22]|uniref:Uncharacterized protein n=1 Tax=Ornithinibacillus hominis TaxID=2763055 RepID=A0A923L8F4_9BACI|nr:hypothetical protein [Ornithinibacillus hominis]MBC5638472.1 hypothetical protein [Ornithinibacillus hominis]